MSPLESILDGFKGRHFDSEVIVLCVRWYLSYKLSSRSLVEMLTGMPGKDRANPDEALLVLGDVRKRLTLVALDAEEYYSALEDAAANAVTGGAIYDALIARCAMKAEAQAIYTWNVKHFGRFGREVAGRVKTP